MTKEEIFENLMLPLKSSLTTDSWEFLLSRGKIFIEQTHADNKRNYTSHFTEWRDKYFKHELKTYEYRSKHNGNEYTIEELEERYEKAMLQSPFEN